MESKVNIEQRQEEDKQLKKLQKEKSSSIIAQSLVSLLDLCVPTCINVRVATVASEERDCLKNCVRSLHATNVRMFQYMMDFEQKQEKDSQ